ncbi:hypothetical protein HK100_007216 [Physocladia obscura]|uniref:Uncharacterized protein n=1 Tax=Physocladia obscura TaxID=109957 RepID=A0AAD5SR49_9FUNG|nr:hypothetical protein HK100_007216 [Physocladia obscura]
MMKTVFLALAVATAANSVLADVIVPSSCEHLVDDMRPRNSSDYRLDSFGNNKTLNLDGGDYGADSNSTLKYYFAETSGHVDVLPGWVSNPADTDATLHPANILASNYFYFKFGIT